jgi:hypothetical protein
VHWLAGCFARSRSDEKKPNRYPAAPEIMTLLRALAGLGAGHVMPMNTMV